MKSQVQYSNTQLSLLLIHLACQISIKLFCECIPSVYVSTSLSVDKILQTASSQVDWSQKYCCCCFVLFVFVLLQ